MDDSIFAVCDIIKGDTGFKFLEYMRDVYLGKRVSNLTADESGEIRDQAIKLGLLRPKHVDQFELTDFSFSEPGFLVGNIAKEYCNWVDNDRVMPPPRPAQEWIAGKDVLDLGCSIGRWLWEFSPHARSVTGLELRQEYIEIGKVLAEREKVAVPPILQGCVEMIDQYFSPESVDFIFCRLVINYVAIRKTLQKMIALLRKDGMLWIEAETFHSGWGKLCKSRGFKARTYGGFGVVNSLICEVTGRQLNFRYHGRHQSSHKAAYPTQRWWLSTLAKFGVEGHLAGYTDGTFCIRGKKE
jgi:2-polyprenyl-3-methyl-5-hydroxy-6-metoxy-1,4-benzoquinol methylase